MSDLVPLQLERRRRLLVEEPLLDGPHVAAQLLEGGQHGGVAAVHGRHPPPGGARPAGRERGEGRLRLRAHLRHRPLHGLEAREHRARLARGGPR